MDRRNGEAELVRSPESPLTPSSLLFCFWADMCEGTLHREVVGLVD